MNDNNVVTCWVKFGFILLDVFSLVKYSKSRLYKEFEQKTIDIFEASKSQTVETKCNQRFIYIWYNDD